MTNIRDHRVRIAWFIVAALAFALVACAAKTYVPTKQEIKTGDKPRRDFANVPPAALNQHRMAMEQFNQGHYAEAARHWRDALQIGARDSVFQYEVHYNLGATFQKMQKYILAEQNFRKAVALDDKNPRGYVGLGSALALQNRQSEALPYFRRALELAPNMPEAYAGLATLALTNGNYEEAVDALRYADSAASGRDDIRTSLLSAYLSLAASRTSENRLDEAQETYALAASIDPKDPRPLLGQGYVMLRRGYPGRARTYYRQAEADAPNYTPAAQDVMPTRRGTPDQAEALRAENMARLFQERGDDERAAQQYRMLLELDPYRTAAWHELADIAVNKLKDRALSADALHALWVLDPKDAVAEELALAYGQNAPEIPAGHGPAFGGAHAGTGVDASGRNVLGESHVFPAGNRVYRLAVLNGASGRNDIEIKLYSPRGELARHDRFVIDVVTDPVVLTSFDTLTYAGSWKQEWYVNGKFMGDLRFELEPPAKTADNN